jgi:hypothetical protein
MPRITIRILSLLLILAVLLAACGDGGSLAGSAIGKTPTAQESGQGGAALPAITETTLIAAGESGSPVLSALAGSYSVASGEQVVAATVGKSGQSGNEAAAQDSPEFQDMKSKVKGAAAVIVDLSTVSKEALSDNALFQAAHEEGVPLVLENVDAERMAAVTGFGVPAEVVVLQPSQEGQEVLVTVLGTAGQHELEAPAAEESKVEGEAGAEDQSIVSAADASKEDQPSVEEQKAEAAALAEQVRNVLANKQSQHSSRTAGTAALFQTIPSRATRTWTVNLPLNRWTPGYGQYAEADIDFQISLYDTVTPDNKWVVVSTVGVGTTPGSMARRDYINRGYYQEKIELEIGPTTQPTGLTLDRMAPASSNDVTQLATATGFTVQMQANGPVASYSGTGSQTMNLDDFQVSNQPTGLKARWVYGLSKVNAPSGTAQKSYALPTDLICTSLPGSCERPDPGLLQLPGLAQAQLTPRNQVVFKVPGTFQENVPFRFWYRHTVREVWRSSVDGTTYSFSNRPRTFSYWLDPSYINFGLVNY